MTLQRKTKKKSVGNRIADITFINEYKQSQKSSLLKTSSKNASAKKNIILGTLRRRQSFNELRTIEAVENCRNKVACKIERFFEQKEMVLNKKFVTEIISKKKLSQILDSKDLVKIYSQVEAIIRHELFVRFNTLIVWNIKKARSEVDWIRVIFSPIQEYQNVKNRTIMVTSIIEALSRKVLSDTIEGLIDNPLFNETLDISTLALEQLDINSRLETKELTDELYARIKGALLSVKRGLVQEINRQIASIFYETHDVFAAKIELKIVLLEEKIARQESLASSLLEA